MGSASVLNILLRNLCHHSSWKYAIFWKFQHDDCMLLTCEDSYISNTKSSNVMEYAPHKEFIHNHPQITSFGSDSNAQIGSITESSIVVAVSNMTRISYLFGEGIIGKAASLERHQWICIEEMNSELFIEYPEELGLQAAAGIKTILLLPVLPLGLVQLGSLDKLSEDLTMVAQLKDSFFAYQYTLYSNSTAESRELQIDSHMTFNRPSLQEYSNNLKISTKSTDPIESQPFTVFDLANPSFDQVMMNEHLSSSSAHLWHPMVQSYDPLPQIGFHHDHGIGLNLFDEIAWNTTYGQLFQGHTSIFPEKISANIGSPAFHEKITKPIPVIGQELTSKIPTMFDANLKDFLEQCDDICALNEANLKHVKEVDLVVESDTNSRYLRLSAELESCECVKSCRSSSERCSESCLTQCKAEDVSNSGDSRLEIPKFSPLILHSEGFTSYLASSAQRNSVHMPLENESHGSIKQVKKSDPHKSRPRDRQLIQDRLRELRELIPNASKCSIEALMERTVKHIMFLQSVPIHADKLRQSSRSKARVKDLKARWSHVAQNEASWPSCEVGSKLLAFPLIVENLDHPYQMLVEMQCCHYELFLDAAHTLKRLGLTILKGLLECRLEQLWAHFILEIPKGFQRVDIIWPLMQLLQLKL